MYTKIPHRYFAKALPNFNKFGQVKIDFKSIIENMSLVEQNCKNRNWKEANPRLVGKLYEKYKDQRYAIDQIRKRKNEHDALLPALRDSYNEPDSDTTSALGVNAENKKEKMLKRHHKIGSSFKSDLKKYTDKLNKIEDELMIEAMKLPNKTSFDTPIGNESKNEVLYIKGEKPNFDFEPKDHLELSKIHDYFDFDNAAKLTGSKNVFLKNQAALLELALVNFGVSKAIKHGFSPILTPDMVRTEVLEGCGFQPRDESSQTYHIMDKNINLSMIGTSEAPLAGMFANEILNKNDLPMKFVAFSHCFRKEAGRGVSSKGLFRLHQFSKVELFVFWEPTKSQEMFNQIVDIQSEILSDLNLHFRALNMASEELGASAFKKIDMEWWFPSKNDYGEVTSVSNWTSFQSRRFNIQYLGEKNEKQLVHTLNGTAVATPRVIMAILENFQNKDGSFNVPNALKPFYLG